MPRSRRWRLDVKKWTPNSPMPEVIYGLRVRFVAMRRDHLDNFIRAGGGIFANSGRFELMTPRNCFESSLIRFLRMRAGT